MKQLKTLVLSLPFVLAAVGCSQDELLPDGGTGTSVPEGLHEVKVTFTVGTSSQLSQNGRGITRAGYDDYTFIPGQGAYKPKNPEPPRELESSNDWQQVNDVRIYVFKENNGNFYYHRPFDASGKQQDYYQVSSFEDKFSSNKNVVWWGGEKDVNEEHSYSIKPLLADGNYKFLAVARDDKYATEKKLTDPNVDSGRPANIKAWKENVTVLDDATIVGTNYNLLQGDELFSGVSNEISVSEGSIGFSQTITLNRAVAGLLIYLENVPANEVAMQDLGSRADGYIDAGESYPVNRISIVSGVGMSDRVIVANPTEAYDGKTNIDNDENLKERFMDIIIPMNQETKTEGNYTYYVNTSTNDKHPNSLLGGCFIMPQVDKTSMSGDGTYDDSMTENLGKSLYLVYYTFTENDAYLPIKWIPIKMKSSSDGNPVESEYYYSIKANHFYSLGRKHYSQDGGTIKDEDDVPIDLKPEGGEGGDNNLVITVNPDWDWKGDLEWAD